MTRQPTVTDAHVRLRPLTEADRPALRRAAADPLIWAQHIDPERHGPTFDRFFDANLASGGALVIEDIASGEVIGHTRFEFMPDVDDAIEVGWTFLTRAHWGTGTNKRVKALVVDYARAQGRRVVLHIAADNTRSRAAAERVGGRLLGAAEHAAWHSAKPNYTTYLLPERIA